MRRAIFIAPGKMEILLSDFIPDYEEGTLARRITQAGLDVVTLDTLVTDHDTVPPAENPDLYPGVRSVTSVTSVTQSEKWASTTSIERKEDSP
jgi:hypothetical protein